MLSENIISFLTVDLKIMLIQDVFEDRSIPHTTFIRVSLVRYLLISLTLFRISILLDYNGDEAFQDYWKAAISNEVCSANLIASFSSS